MSDEDGFPETESLYEAFVFLGPLFAVILAAVVIGVWVCVSYWW